MSGVPVRGLRTPTRWWGNLEPGALGVGGVVDLCEQAQPSIVDGPEQASEPLPEAERVAVDNERDCPVHRGVDPLALRPIPHPGSVARPAPGAGVVFDHQSPEQWRLVAGPPSHG